MSSEANAYREMIHMVTQTTSGSRVGCALYLDYVDSNHFQFTFVRAAEKKHTLRAEVTSIERLQAHWDGFVANETNAA